MARKRPAQVSNSNYVNELPCCHWRPDGRKSCPEIVQKIINPKCIKTLLLPRYIVPSTNGRQYLLLISWDQILLRFVSFYELISLWLVPMFWVSLRTCAMVKGRYTDMLEKWHPNHRNIPFFISHFARKSHSKHQFPVCHPMALGNGGRWCHTSGWDEAMQTSGRQSNPLRPPRIAFTWDRIQISWNFPHLNGQLSTEQTTTSSTNHRSSYNVKKPSPVLIEKSTNLYLSPLPHLSMAQCWTLARRLNVFI